MTSLSDSANSVQNRRHGITKKRQIHLRSGVGNKANEESLQGIVQDRSDTDPHPHIAIRGPKCAHHISPNSFSPEQ